MGQVGHVPSPPFKSLATTVVLCYKNFAAQQGLSHIGLGVAALNTCKVLRRHGIECHVWPLTGSAQLKEYLAAHPEVTHVVISAFWIPTVDLGMIAYAHPNVSFVVNCHSNVGFLQADPRGIQIFKELINAERNSWNIMIAANSQKFCRWTQDTFEAKCLYLPNLYYLDETTKINPPRFQQGGVLRIGVFGANRVLKNILSAGAAALSLSSQLRCDVELWVSGGRTDGGDTMLRSLTNLFQGEANKTLKVAPWTQWPEFKARYVRMMHLLMQPSYTETFNMVTADGIAEGIPSVVSDAIDWVPPSWVASFDDAYDIAQTARRLLVDTHAASEGLRALEAHNNAGLTAWVQHLTGQSQHSAVHGYRR